MKGEAEEGKCGIMRKSVNGESGLFFYFRFKVTLGRSSDFLSN